MMDYHRQNGVDIRIARIFNTYGPRMALEDGRVVSNFIAQALRGEDITVFGDGSQTRSFCYVDDLVEGLMRLMEREGIDRPDQHWQPRRDDHPRVRQEDRGAHRLTIEARLQAAARRTIPGSASRTSPSPGSGWAGSPGSTSTPG